MKNDLICSDRSFVDNKRTWICSLHNFLYQCVHCVHMYVYVSLLIFQNVVTGNHLSIADTTFYLHCMISDRICVCSSNMLKFIKKGSDCYQFLETRKILVSWELSQCYKFAVFYIGHTIILYLGHTIKLQIYNSK